MSSTFVVASTPSTRARLRLSRIDRSQVRTSLDLMARPKGNCDECRSVLQKASTGTAAGPHANKRARNEDASLNSASGRGRVFISAKTAASGTASTPAATSMKPTSAAPMCILENVGPMKVIARWLRLDDDAIDGVEATAGASEAAPELGTAILQIRR